MTVSDKAPFVTLKICSARPPGREYGDKWQVVEAEGIQPFYHKFRFALSYAIEQSRFFPAGEILIYNRLGHVMERMPFKRRSPKLR